MRDSLSAEGKIDAAGLEAGSGRDRVDAGADEDEQQTIKNLERQLVDIVTHLLVRLDAEGRIVKRTKKIYTMILFGIINYTYTWYDPKGGIGPQEFADMAVGLFLHGLVPGGEAKSAAVPETLGHRSSSRPCRSTSFLVGSWSPKRLVKEILS
jgi:Tetracyclin repressor-like, C-terminal domain